MSFVSSFYVPFTTNHFDSIDFSPSLKLFLVLVGIFIAFSLIYLLCRNCGRRLYTFFLNGIIAICNNHSTVIILHHDTPNIQQIPGRKQIHGTQPIDPHRIYSYRTVLSAKLVMAICLDAFSMICSRFILPLKPFLLLSKTDQFILQNFIWKTEVNNVETQKT